MPKASRSNIAGPKAADINQVANAMTIDVEDYFHVEAFSSVINSSHWGKRYPLRAQVNTERVLTILDEHDVKATFFVLGWVAQQCPSIVRAIVNEGHEVASHGYFHQRANRQSRQAFYDDVVRSKELLEDISGQAVLGYRAPSFSIDTSNPWAFEVLKKLGFAYSSSTYPVKHDLYGVPDWPRFRHVREEGVVEVPIPTLQKLERNIPIGGGGFFRLYPYWLSKYLINAFMTQTSQPYSFYFHPWEVDPQQPRIIGVSAKSRFRHYLNLSSMEAKLHRLLTDFRWSTMRNVYQLNGFENDAGSSNQEVIKERLPSMG